MKFAALDVSGSTILSPTCPHVIPAETVEFSSRAELLVSKLGRSSKPSPRFLIVVCCTPVIRLHPLTWLPVQTQKAVYIAVTNASKDGGTITTLDRKIPLITIKSIAMSNLRDDWLVGCLIRFKDGLH
jgi:myosin I